MGESETIGDIPGLVSAIVERIGATECKDKKCTVAISDYELPNGNITVYGMQIADVVARELVKQGYKAEGIEQQHLRTYLTDSAVSADPSNREKICQMARKLNVRFVVLGTIEKADDTLARVSTFVIGADRQNCAAGRPIVGRGPLPPANDLEPLYVFDPSLKIAHMTLPHCDYMPNPPYPELAREYKESGVVQVAAALNTEGQMEYVRIIHGLRYGLNEAALATMRKWRCHPAIKDKTPIATLVEFEFNFRTY